MYLVTFLCGGYVSNLHWFHSLQYQELELLLLFLNKKHSSKLKGVSALQANQINDQRLAAGFLVLW